ncbi:Stomatin-like protein 2, mitochondrial [Parelaphostrongylus tenuis]|uniref:Stomatin-like protein 2, mitochondrial n=1 Tax=Parelaphostrongylus tenuis TaxID=148309 RepID=A0AAD5R034_PARTN|nr:Stomatin-like protein 2, mitochondrial [Parelaphostrongylus tenuis]
MNSSLVRSHRLLAVISRSTLPLQIIINRGAHARNTFINFVPQQEAWVVERMGKFYKILEPGFNVLIPFIDRIRFVQSLREIAIEIPQQGAITLDNVQLQLDGVLLSYGVDDPEFAVTQLAQTTMRSEVGKISLDTVFREREQLNVSIVTAINKAAEPWGIKCMRYEISMFHGFHLFL